MCTVLLPPGDNPIAVNKYIISYHINPESESLQQSADNQLITAEIQTPDYAV